MDQPPVPPNPAPSPPTPSAKSSPGKAFLAGRGGFLVIGLVVGGLVGGIIGAGASRGKTTTAISSPVATTPTPKASSPTPRVSVLPSPAETESPTPEFVLPDPEAEYSRSCDYVLGDFSENTSTGFRFVAGSDITNTGNVGIEVTLKASFKQLGADPIVVTKKGKVPWDETRSLNVTKPVSQDQLSLIQAAQSGGDICSVEVEITGTYGETHSG